MDRNNYVEKENDIDLTESMALQLQFDEEMEAGSLGQNSLSDSSLIKCSSDAPTPDRESVNPDSESIRNAITQSLTRGCVPNVHRIVTSSTPGSPCPSAPISIPASRHVITGFDGPTSSPGTATSQPLSVHVGLNGRSSVSGTTHQGHGEVSSSLPSRNVCLSVSPGRGTFGSLLSQRLSGMTQEQKPAPKAKTQHLPLPQELGSMQKSPQQQEKAIGAGKPVCFPSPASQKSIASSPSQTSTVSHKIQTQVSGGSTNTMDMSTPQLKKKKMKKPLKVDIPKRHHTFSESAGVGQSPASLRSLFGSITVWRSSSILSRHLSQGGSSRIVNYVTEAQSVLPSLTSAFSIDHLEEKEICRPVELAMYDLQNNQRAVSHQDKLEMLDILEDNEYVDTVKSTDSAASLLRRSMSVPPQYHYKSQKRHMQDIFNPPQAEKEDSGPINDKPPQKLSPIPNVENGHQWRQTMDDLLEQPEYLDTLESVCSRTGLLASQAQAMAQQYGTKPVLEPTTESPSTLKPPEEKVPIKQLRFIYLKNLIVLSLGFMFIFMAYMSLRNLQSSLYKKGGLGLLALSLIYANLFLGCIFATTVVQHLRPKRTILLCMCSVFLYVVANFYPSYYTLLPACAITGFCLSNLWTAHATYLANVAARYAILVDDKVQNVLSQFNGIFFAFFQMSQIVGGLISSLVLSPSKEMLGISMSNSTNVTNIVMLNVDNMSMAYLPQCGAAYCSYLADSSESSDANSAVDKKMFYILVGTYAGCVVIGLAIILLCLDPLDGVMKKTQTSLSKQLTAVFRFFLQWKVACLLGLMFYTMLQTSFMFGEFTKAFVTCTSGVYLVGYTMVCLSGMSALSSFISGRVQRYVGRQILFGAAFLVHLSLIITQLMWRPGPDHIVIIFVIAGCWGLADGILLTQTISLFGVLFAENKEPAFAGLKMTQALGVTILFATAEYLCTYMKLLILLCFAVFAIIGLTTLEIRLKNEKKKQQNVEPTTV